MIENFISNYEYYKDISLKKYNTYKLDAKCRFLIFPQNEEELLNLLNFLKSNNIDYLILGGGSNVILARSCFDVVIKLDRLNEINITDNIVIAGAGVSLPLLSNTCMKKGLNGLSFAGGLPGLVGASTAMNAGAYNEDMASVVKEAKVITPDLNIIRMSNNDLKYSYRNSFLKENKDYICIETTFQLYYEDSINIKQVMDSRIKRRIESQPLDMPSAGSVFRNPDGFSAGRLIEDIGLKGYTVGGAMVSNKHANFIVNTGTATYDDIIQLIEYIRDKVMDEYGIELVLEQEIIR